MLYLAKFLRSWTLLGWLSHRRQIAVTVPERRWLSVTVVSFQLLDVNKEEEAKHILSKIYRPGEVEEEMRAMQESIEAEKAEEGLIGHSLAQKLKGALSNKVVQRALYAGITVQVAQQFFGINTVMYYNPTIVQFAGIASNSTALALSLVTSGLNAVGTIVSMVFIGRCGRRKLMLISMIGIIVCLIMLCYIQPSSSPCSCH